MEISFVWTNLEPESQSRNNAEARFLLALEVGNTRKLEPKKLVIHLKPNNLATSINGVGYDENEKPLFIFTHSQGGQRNGSYCYYYGETDPRESLS